VPSRNPSSLLAQQACGSRITFNGYAYHIGPECLLEGQHSVIPLFHIRRFKLTGKSEHHNLMATRLLRLDISPAHWLNLSNLGIGL
jgi:hypothetical protein